MNERMFKKKKRSPNHEPLRELLKGMGLIATVATGAADLEAAKHPEVDMRTGIEIQMRQLELRNKSHEFFWRNLSSEMDRPELAKSQPGESVRFESEISEEYERMKELRERARQLVSEFELRSVNKDKQTNRVLEAYNENPAGIEKEMAREFEALTDKEKSDMIMALQHAENLYEQIYKSIMRHSTDVLRDIVMHPAPQENASLRRVIDLIDEFDAMNLNIQDHAITNVQKRMILERFKREQIPDAGTQYYRNPG